MGEPGQVRRQSITARRKPANQSLLRRTPGVTRLTYSHFAVLLAKRRQVATTISKARDTRHAFFRQLGSCSSRFSLALRGGSEHPTRQGNGAIDHASPAHRLLQPTPGVIED